MLPWFRSLNGILSVRPSRREPRSPYARPTLERLEDRLAPATFSVRNANDSGSGSLRQAILDSNSTAGTNIIRFTIGTGAQTIALLSALPAVQNNPLTIDGTSQPGFAGTPLIELNGARAGANVSGLRILASNCTVQDLVINRFSLDGIEIQGGSGAVVQGNFIGTDATASLALGNQRTGILLDGGASSSLIGGNVIAFNQQPGVALQDATTAGNAIQANSIFSNGGLGIDLGRDGVTVNHTGGSTTGPNHWQNQPILQTASPGDSTTVTGTLNGLPNTTFQLDFYASSAPDLSFFGQGQRYLATVPVSTDATGNVRFSLTVPAATNTGEWLTATATDSAGNTSEFSGALQLPATGLGINSTTWTPIGPAPVAVSPLLNPPIGAGRVSVAAPDPSNPNVMYLGADGGGVWKTNDWLDPSPVWTPLTDYQSSLNFNDSSYQALTVFPGNSQIVYAAVSGPGGGILASTDGGATWTLLANPLFDRVFFGTLVVSPVDPNTLYVSVRGGNIPLGLYQSTDGGQNWTNQTAGIHAGGVSDVVMDPTNPLVLYAGFINGGATNGIYKTNNGGATWTQLSNGVPTGSAVGLSIRLALGPSAPQTVYATVFTSSTSYPLRYRTTNGGTNWSRLPTLPEQEDPRYSHAVLSVDPTDPRVVYANAVGSVYRSTDGGQNWTVIYAEDPVGIFFDSAGGVVLVGDRGIYRWAGPGNPFTNRQGNLQITQFYTLTLDPNDPDIVYGVSQDHFRYLKFSGYPVWNQLGTPPGNPPSGGETGKILVDPRDGNRVYAYDPIDYRSFILRSDDGGATWVEKGSGISTTVVGFDLAYTAQKAFQLDPANPDRLLVGTNRVYETTNDGDSWTPISPVLTSGVQFITALAIAPSQPGMIYAATSDGRVFVTSNDGGTWQEEDQGLPRDAADHLVDIEVDPQNPNRAFTVPGTFPTGVFGNGRVWMTTDGGNSWVEISGNLPPTFWTNALVVDWRSTPPVLYVGTAHGVYSSADLGNSWAPFGQALPNAAVTDLQFLPQFNLLAAATYGRGVFEILVQAGDSGRSPGRTPPGRGSGRGLGVIPTGTDTEVFEALARLQDTSPGGGGLLGTGGADFARFGSLEPAEAGPFVGQAVDHFLAARRASEGTPQGEEAWVDQGLAKDRLSESALSSGEMFEDL
jgi:photosystem II stability/assembly factor-like uncharacterized protein